MPVMTITWRTSPEHHNCPLCEEMDGKVIGTFEVGKDPFPVNLTWGGDIVWDCITDHSMAHVAAKIDWECYCKLEIHFDTSDLEEQIRELAAVVKSTLTPTTVTEGVEEE